MKKVYMFYSPLDSGPFLSNDLEALRVKAKGYLGGEDWEGETVTKVNIYEVVKIEELLLSEANGN